MPIGSNNSTLGGYYSAFTLGGRAFDYNVRTGTSETLSMADLGGCSMSNGSASVLTIPPNSAVNFQIGQIIPLLQLGSGSVTVSPDVGVTLNSLGGVYTLAGQYATATLTQTALNVWNLSTDTSSGGGGGVAVGDSPTWTGNHVWQQTLAVSNTAAAQRLVNPGAASSGSINQRYSPATQWEGFGWNTAIPASQSVRFRSYAVPVLGSGLTDSKLVFESSINSGPWTENLSIGPVLTRFSNNVLAGFNLTVTGTLTAGTIEGLNNLKLKELSDPVYQNTILFLSSVAPTDDRQLYIDLQDGGRNLSIGADWTLGDYTATAPTVTGKISVIINGQAYEIAARLVP